MYSIIEAMIYHWIQIQHIGTSDITITRNWLKYYDDPHTTFIVQPSGYYYFPPVF